MTLPNDLAAANAVCCMVQTSAKARFAVAKASRKVASVVTVPICLPSAAWLWKHLPWLFGRKEDPNYESLTSALTEWRMFGESREAVKK